MAVATTPAGDAPISYFTFRPTDGALVEDRLVRGVHPMVGRRLNLWRLTAFDVTRLEAPEDVLLYECVARDNPDDRRLVALAQVRQVVVVRDDEGQVTGLPHVERAIANCLEAVRGSAPAGAPRASKLDMNHVWVQIWPTIEADLGQLTALQTRIAPLTAGAGIEEVLVQANVATAPDEAPCRSPAASSTSPARASSAPSARRRPSGSSPSTTTPPRSCGPAAAASSTPTSCSR